MPLPFAERKIWEGHGGGGVVVMVAVMVVVVGHAGVGLFFSFFYINSLAIFVYNNSQRNVAGGGL